jgi:hypothetical protein
MIVRAICRRKRIYAHESIGLLSNSVKEGVTLDTT